MDIILSVDELNQTPQKPVTFSLPPASEMPTVPDLPLTGSFECTFEMRPKTKIWLKWRFIKSILRSAVFMLKKVMSWH